MGSEQRLTKFLKLRKSLVRRAENGIRTRGLQFGKLMLYQLSYFRLWG
jgi:hypothetical protein